MALLKPRFRVEPEGGQPLDLRLRLWRRETLAGEVGVITASGMQGIALPGMIVQYQRLEPQQDLLLLRCSSDPTM